ncbi:hypothetical protein Hdeb2414_s0006g00198961 [Helianthus debilis subsp. tardiflorus]
MVKGKATIRFISCGLQVVTLFQERVTWFASHARCWIKNLVSMFVSSSVHILLGCYGITGV